MNAANLQIEGLLIAMASLNSLLVSKGIVSHDEMTKALDVAEQIVLGDERMGELDPAQRDAMVFPVRLLRLASDKSSTALTMPFSELAKMVGRTKGRYNDQE